MFKMCREKWKVNYQKKLRMYDGKRRVNDHGRFGMRQKKWKVSGHITLEVAVLLPIIVLLMVWLVYFMIFLLDMAVVKSEVIRISDEAAAIWDKDGDLPTGEYKLPSRKTIFSGFVSGAKSNKVQGKASSRLKKRIRDRLSLTKPRGQKVSVGSGNVTAQVSVSFSWPFSSAIVDYLHGLQFTGRGMAPVDDWKDQMRAASAYSELLK